jgi:hypothetical protein
MTETDPSPDRDRLLKDFESVYRMATPVLVSRFGEAAAAEIGGETRREYKSLIPKIPYVGGKEPFTRYIISTAQYTALYRVLRSRGLSLEEMGQLIYDSTDRVLSRYPGFITRFITGSIFSRRFVRRVRERAEESQRREYPGNYVFSFVEGDGVEFDYGVDYTECGVCKFLEAEDALELAPYICKTDILSSDKLGWGLKRTMTIAEGYPICDFRFKKGGKTNVASGGLPIGSA